MNPFTDEYVRKELSFYGYKTAGTLYEQNGIRVVGQPLVGRCDDYLNVNMRFDESLVAPALTIDGTIWMSLTPMEVQSHVVPIKAARGKKKIGIAGLGMGYCALRIAYENPEAEVCVWEIDQRVIEAFFALHGDTRKNLKIFHGDAREGMLMDWFDYAYFDIYPTIASGQELEDLTFFRENLDCPFESQYFWGEELFAYLANAHGILCEEDLTPLQLELFRDFESTSLADLRPPMEDVRYVQEWFVCRDLVMS